jgi:hypothetical protein
MITALFIWLFCLTIAVRFLYDNKSTSGLVDNFQNQSVMRLSEKVTHLERLLLAEKLKTNPDVTQAVKELSSPPLTQEQLEPVYQYELDQFRAGKIQNP